MSYQAAGARRCADGQIIKDQIIPIIRGHWFLWLSLLFMLCVVPVIGNEYWLTAVLTPVLILSLTGLGLNILTGYAGQLSLGTGGFMGVGAFAAFNFMLRIPHMNLLAAIFLAGIVAGLFGLFFGIPSMRIKGFYVIVSTLAAQYFIYWLIVAFPYFMDYASNGLVTLPPHDYEMFGVNFDTPRGKYILTLLIVTALTISARNMIGSSIGRNWMAVRDYDIAASVIGIRVNKTKLVAFFVSSFYVGVAGALYSYCYLGQVDPSIYDLRRSFVILFMIIIGGLGSISGSFLGAVFVYYFPVLMSMIGSALTGGAIDAALVENISQIIYGALIIILLIREPDGFAAIWSKFKRKVQSWPFSY